MPVIEVSHLTKEYRLGALQGLNQTLLNTAARLTGKKIEERPLFKALDDVSFSIESGEVLDHNGTGKRTPPGLLTRIYKTSRRCCRVRIKAALAIEAASPRSLGKSAVTC